MPGSDFHVVSATDAAGTVWLAWQGWRKDNYQILVASQKGGVSDEPRVITTSQANDWGPAIVADRKGSVYVAWDTYDKGNYDVWLQDVTRDGRRWAVAESTGSRRGRTWPATRTAGSGSGMRKGTSSGVKTTPTPAT